MKNKLYNKQLPAREVYEALCYSRQKCGTPYLLNKDSINEKNAQSNIGTIRLSNLCTEILEYADERVDKVCLVSTPALKSFGYFFQEMAFLKPIRSLTIS